MLHVAIPSVCEPRSRTVLPSPKSVMARSYSVAEAERIYLDASHRTDSATAAGRVYLADLAEALCLSPIRWRALQRRAEAAAASGHAAATHR